MSSLSSENSFRIHLAPMEGVFDPITRQLFAEIGGYDRLFTEFVRVTSQLLPDHVFYRYSPELTAGGKVHGVPVVVQLLGGDAACLADNAARAVELGSPGIDLNFGCPAKTVNRHDGGATLLKYPERIEAIVASVRRAVPMPLPVSAKIRLGFDDKLKCLEIAQAVENGGADFLTVHARTRQELYDPPAYWEYVAQIREVLRRTRVLANGEIWSVDDYHRCVQISGTKDVALGRGAFANPWLAQQIRAAISEEQLLKQNGSQQPQLATPLPMNQFVSQVFPQFVSLSKASRGENFAVARSKQWIRAMALRNIQFQDLFQVVKTMKLSSEILFAVEAHRAKAT
jgi:tRNA-dihydrouridine synthase C